MSILGRACARAYAGASDASYSKWKLAEAHPKPADDCGAWGGGGSDRFWERILIFLIRDSGCQGYKNGWRGHPQDQVCLPQGSQGGIGCWGRCMWLKEFVRRFREGDVSRLNLLAKGTFSERLARPGKEIYD